jgi:hypothetical protein
LPRRGPAHRRQHRQAAGVAQAAAVLDFISLSFHSGGIEGGNRWLGSCDGKEKTHYNTRWQYQIGCKKESSSCEAREEALKENCGGADCEEAFSNSKETCMDNDRHASGVDNPTRFETPQAEMTPLERAKFKCIRNANYHSDLERFYARWHKIFMFLVVALGTAAIGSAVTHDNIYATVGTGLAVLAGLVDLVWDVDGRARLHSDLRRRSYDLLARLEANEDIRAIEVEFVRLVGDEPPPMYAVDALAFNTAVDALGRPPGQKYVLAMWQRWVRHWLAFRSNQFPTEEKIAAATAAAAR